MGVRRILKRQYVVDASEIVPDLGVSQKSILGVNLRLARMGARTLTGACILTRARLLFLLYTFSAASVVVPGVLPIAFSAVEQAVVSVVVSMAVSVVISAEVSVVLVVLVVLVVELEVQVKVEAGSESRQG
ncbi:hypothetical protein Q9L58_008967 [Maublancomyces gigas]|uniref:Uncharacterized protein n=1 Tax=Discina gigas TaxID=1032678 RepID=A0ABR3G890_9PEZI